MIYLSSFLGRTVSHVNCEEKHLVFRFSDFSMVFLTGVESSGAYEQFLGQKFLYIQKHGDLAFFHFSSALFFSVKMDSGPGIPQYIMLRNKDKEVLLRLDDGKTYEGV